MLRRSVGLLRLNSKLDPASLVCLSTSLLEHSRSNATSAITSRSDRSRGRRTPSHTKQSDKDQVARNTVFAASTASSRPYPNAVPLFGKLSGLNSLQDTVRSLPRLSQDTITLRNATTDPILRDLFSRLGNASDRGDVALALDICASIKEHVGSRPSSSDSDRLLLPHEVGVYHALLKCFSQHGLLEQVLETVEDMKMCQFQVGIEALNWVLSTAVVRGDADVIEQTLDQIHNLSRDQETEAPEDEAPRISDQADDAQDNTKSLSFQPFPSSQTRNWTSATFTHMILSATVSYNLEMGLALLAACLRDGIQMEHDAFMQILNLCLHTEEFRLATELAYASEIGGLASILQVSESPSHTDRPTRIARKLAPSLWMRLLAANAEGGYLPGVELAWQKAVVEGLLVPDEGTMLQALSVAAGEGSIKFAVLILERLYPGFKSLLGNEAVSSAEQARKKRPGRKDVNDPLSRGIVLQEWHLAPLFEAQCTSIDFEGAIRTLSLMKVCGHPVSTNSCTKLTLKVYKDKVMLTEAFQALLKLGSNPNCGVDIAAVNALIRAAVWGGRMPLAMEMYKASWQLYNAIQDGTPQAPLELKAGSVLGPMPGDEGQGIRVRPNLETFHELFIGCIDTLDRQLGALLLSDLNSLLLQPTILTYERMILLCLTQSSYEDAFGFLEQAKLNGLRPTRKSYEGVIRRCFSAKDERWKWGMDEMKEAGFRPSRLMCNELGLEEEEAERMADRGNQRREGSWNDRGGRGGGGGNRNGRGGQRMRRNED